MRTSVEKSVNSRMAGTPDFQLDCFPFIFTRKELEVLRKKGHSMKALSEGRQRPVTPEEFSFVKVCHGQANPLSVMETAWIKYIHRGQIEASLLQTEELYREYLRIRKS